MLLVKNPGFRRQILQRFRWVSRPAGDWIYTANRAHMDT